MGEKGELEREEEGEEEEVDCEEEVGRKKSCEEEVEKELMKPIVYDSEDSDRSGPKSWDDSQNDPDSEDGKYSYTPRFHQM